MNSHPLSKLIELIHKTTLNYCSRYRSKWKKYWNEAL